MSLATSATGVHLSRGGGSDQTAPTTVLFEDGGADAAAEHLEVLPSGAGS